MERKRTGSLEKRGRKLRLLALGCLAALAALVAYAALSRPDKKERASDQARRDLVGLMLAGGDGATGAGQMMDIISGASVKGADPQKLKALRDVMKKMDEPTRRQLVRDSLKTYLDHARKQAVGFTKEQGRELVNKMTLDIRERFSSMSPKQREKAAAALNSEKGKKQLRETLDFYFNEFSAQEQETMLPLVREVLINMNAL